MKNKNSVEIILPFCFENFILFASDSDWIHVRIEMILVEETYIKRQEFYFKRALFEFQ